jgi:hypothetical protein
MQTKPEVRTENTTDKDRELMYTLLRVPLRRKLMIYLPISLGSICAIILFNLYDVRFDLDETKRGIGNMIFVLCGAFFLRLSISDIMNYHKDHGHFQVKTAQGPIRSASGKSITIGNYEFHFPSPPTELFEEGDQVELRASYKTASIFMIRKLS